MDPRVLPRALRRGAVPDFDVVAVGAHRARAAAAKHAADAAPARAARRVQLLRRRGAAAAQAAALVCRDRGRARARLRAGALHAVRAGVCALQDARLAHAARPGAARRHRRRRRRRRPGARPQLVCAVARRADSRAARPPHRFGGAADGADGRNAAQLRRHRHLAVRVQGAARRRRASGGAARVPADACAAAGGAARPRRVRGGARGGQRGGRFPLLLLAHSRQGDARRHRRLAAQLRLPAGRRPLRPAAADRLHAAARARQGAAQHAAAPALRHQPAECGVRHARRRRRHRFRAAPCRGAARGARRGGDAGALPRAERAPGGAAAALALVVRARAAGGAPRRDQAAVARLRRRRLPRLLRGEAARPARVRGAALGRAAHLPPARQRRRPRPAPRGGARDPLHVRPRPAPRRGRAAAARRRRDCRRGGVGAAGGRLGHGADGGAAGGSVRAGAKQRVAAAAAPRAALGRAGAAQSLVARRGRHRAAPRLVGRPVPLLHRGARARPRQRRALWRRRLARRLPRAAHAGAAARI
mmetsp:Transcript_40801/g.135059  ORF Transcript_40801/g.135059 Transcript_40801/m.135059 type:complete len:532 (+) Transcript_40801:1931-3526(+)